MDTQSRSQEVTNICKSSEAKAVSLKKEVNDSAKILQEHQENVVAAVKRAKQSKTEASIMKAKADHLQKKIAARKAAKVLVKILIILVDVFLFNLNLFDLSFLSQKKQLEENSSSTFKVPEQNLIPQREVTPQYMAPAEEENDRTPRSILKTASKPPTPQQQAKKVSFVDFNDSSSSSIILEVSSLFQLIKIFHLLLLHDYCSSH